MPGGSYLSLNRISCDRYWGWKLSESTPLFQRRILLAGHQTRDKRAQVFHYQLTIVERQRNKFSQFLAAFSIWIVHFQIEGAWLFWMPFFFLKKNSPIWTIYYEIDDSHGKNGLSISSKKNERIHFRKKTTQQRYINVHLPLLWLLRDPSQWQLMGPVWDLLLYEEILYKTE